MMLSSAIFANLAAVLVILLWSSVTVKADDSAEESAMTKMCLSYPNESGHARSDPILNQDCPSDHVHTFYGPQNFHPKTSNNQLRATKPQDSSSPWVENQSLYWHPSIYRVTTANGKKKYTRVNNIDMSPYYRWNTQTSPETVEFPKSFRMIATSDQENAQSEGDIGGSLIVECCNFLGGDEEREDCTETFNQMIFPRKTCDFLGIGFAMPTCWDTRKGVGKNDPYNHVAYTTNGRVDGPCPPGYNKRIPQIQLFIRIHNYRGGTYQLSDGKDVFHVDFMNGWKPGKLTRIMERCVPTGEPGYNPPCDCTQFLTLSENPAVAACDSEVKRYIVDEDTDVVTSLPRGTCKLADLVPKTWGSNPPFQNECGNVHPDHGDGDSDDGDEDCYEECNTSARRVLKGVQLKEGLRKQLTNGINKCRKKPELDTFLSCINSLVDRYVRKRKISRKDGSKIKNNSRGLCDC